MVVVVMEVRDAPLAMGGIADAAPPLPPLLSPAPPPPPAAAAAADALLKDEKPSHPVPRHATTQRQLQVKIL